MAGKEGGCALEQASALSFTHRLRIAPGVALLSGVLALAPIRMAKMIGVHLGLLQSLLLAPLFIWRATLAW